MKGLPFLCIFFSLLISCNKQSHWAFDQIHSDKAEFRSTKLTYYARDPVNGIDIEFLKSDDHLNAYLNIHSTPVKPHKEEPTSALLTINIEGEVMRCRVYRLAGGQRFLISEATVQTLVDALRNHKALSIALAGYHTVVQPGDFASKFEKFLNPLSIENPFRLPF
jgi:hypothetical protein